MTNETTDNKIIIHTNKETKQNRHTRVYRHRVLIYNIHGFAKGVNCARKVEKSVAKLGQATKICMFQATLNKHPKPSDMPATHFSKNLQTWRN